MAETKKVLKKDTVVVVGTGKGKFLAKGKKETVHSLVADKLVKSGVATLEEEKDTKAKK